MNRLLVALLAALDAVLAAAGGIAVALAPLTLLWVIGLGDADWSALWPASASVWQLGHLVPLSVQLPEEYLAVAGIDPAAASFTLSLAPLAFTVFTALFAGRSGGRAALAGAPITGVVSGSVVFAAASAAVVLTSGNGVVSAEPWQAILFPSLVFALPCLVGAIVRGWAARVEPIATLRTIAERWHGAWPHVPGAIVRGTAVAVLGLVAVGAGVFAVGLLVRGGQVVALFQTANVDVIGATLLALGQLVYLPTLVVWALSFVIGPGFALGTGSAVSPSGTQLGVLPGIPALGAVPDSTSPWLLLLALLPVAVGALTGWMLRSRLLADAGVAASTALGPRLAIVAGAAVLPAGVVALLAVVASGSFGPGRLAETGPDAGTVALAVGVELGLGLGILLLAPARASAGERADAFEEYVPVAERSSTDGLSWRTLSAPHLYEHHSADTEGEPAATADAGDEQETAPLAPVRLGGESRGAAGDAASLPAPDGAVSASAPVAAASTPATDEQETAPIEPLGLDSAQATEPIIDFERGSGGRRRSEDEPGGSVD